MFKVTMQYAHHSDDEFEVLFENYTGDGKDVFETINWSEEVDKANELQKVSPTLSFESVDGSQVLWVSVVGEGNQIHFYTDYSYPGTKSFFGLFKREARVSSYTESFSKRQVAQAFHLFTTNSPEKLKQLFKDANT